MPADIATPLSIILQGASPPEIRAAVARFALDNSEKIRAIARRKLSAATRAVHDSEDVFSSVLRRLDGMAAQGTLRPSSETELWGLIAVIAHNCAVSRTRLIERTKKVLTDDGPLAYEMLKRLTACRSDEEATVLFNRLLMALPDSADRQMLDLQYRGASHNAIAGFFAITPEASRQRWRTVRKKLLAILEKDGFND